MYRERAAGMYSELPFASAQCLIEVPYNLAQALLFSLICYFMLGFDHAAGGRSPAAAQPLISEYRSSALYVTLLSLRRAEINAAIRCNRSENWPGMCSAARREILLFHPHDLPYFEPHDVSLWLCFSP